MHPPELVGPPARIEALFTDYLRRRDGGEALSLADFAREHADCAAELALLERNWRRVAAVLELLLQHGRRAPRGGFERRARELSGPAPGVPVPADRRGSVSLGTSGASAQD